MYTKLVLFLFVMTIIECNGHIPILGDIISTAKDRVHSTIEGVAGAVLGGFNLNFGGHLGFNNQEHPQYVPQKNPQETIVVVVEEDNANDYRPPIHNNYRPIHQDHRPHHHFRPGNGDQNQDTYNQNEHENPGKLENGNNFQLYNQNERPNDQNSENYNNNQFDQNNPNRPVEDQTNHNQNPYKNGNTEEFYNNPTTEHIKTTVPVESSSYKDENKNNIGTEKPSDDLPLFIPLNPDEYVYGGDKINITAPKRDTEKTKKTELEDEDFNVDIRFKNE